MDPTEVIDRPEWLRGRSLEEVMGLITAGESWRTEVLRRGSAAGAGWVLRQYDSDGQPTGRMIRWHPGGGHHGPGPYWRVTSPEGGRSAALSAGAGSGTMTP